MRTITNKPNTSAQLLSKDRMKIQSDLIGNYKKYKIKSLYDNINGCQNRAGLADLKYTVATEACADRQSVNEALRDVIASNTANTQTILDKLCQQEIDALKAQNQQLQMQSYLASLAASQNAQTGQILNDNAAQTTTLLRALDPAPVPAYIVQNHNGCNCGNNSGCGCGGFYN